MFFLVLHSSLPLLPAPSIAAQTEVIAAQLRIRVIVVVVVVLVAVVVVAGIVLCLLYVYVEYSALPHNIFIACTCAQ